MASERQTCRALLGASLFGGRIFLRCLGAVLAFELLDFSVSSHVAKDESRKTSVFVYLVTRVAPG